MPDFDRIWMPFTYHADALAAPPIVIAKGSGVFLYDTRGREYLDAVGSWWVSIFGHNHPRISAAVRAQLDKVEHLMMAGFVSDTTLELSHRLGALLPRPLTRVFFSDNGSTAVEVALKIALQFHALRGRGRDVFVGLGWAYHGDTLGAMSVGNIPRYHALFHERFRSGAFIDALRCYRCPAGKEASSCAAECLNPLEEFFARESETVAACIFEPMVQGAAGMLVYPARALKRLFAICRHYGVLTIADEVAMGFGRTGRLFACDHAGEVPDMMCLAKGLTGGYLPLSATAVTDEIFAEFKGDYSTDRILNHGHSFTGNPLASAAACASLALIEEGRVPASLSPVIEYFAGAMKRFESCEWAGDLRTIGMVGAVEIVQDRRSKKPHAPHRRVGYRVGQTAIAKGVIVRPLGNVLYFMPPYIITTEQIDHMIDTAIESVNQVLGAETGRG